MSFNVLNIIICNRTLTLVMGILYRFSLSDILYIWKRGSPTSVGNTQSRQSSYPEMCTLY